LLAETNITEQSGVIAYAISEGDVFVVLVSSLDKKRWVLPKGHIAPGMSAKESAEKEAFEEAGIKGRIATPEFGFYDYRKKRHCGVHRVFLFPMEVTRLLDEWPDGAVRQRCLVPVPAAVKAVKEKNLKKLLRKFGKEISLGKI
jgi:8-oxo-dGTP pyrophosphatase MutT (NUDIX family)